MRKAELLAVGDVRRGGRASGEGAGGLGSGRGGGVGWGWAVEIP